MSPLNSLGHTAAQIAKCNAIKKKHSGKQMEKTLSSMYAQH